MKDFYEICKVLINSDSSYEEDEPHAMVTSIDHYTQVNPSSVQFDYASIYKREDKYHDIVGFYHTHPSGMNCMSSIDIETMKQWVGCLGKSLVCLIETEEQINGWAFVKDGDEITHRPINVSTNNDVNYDIWFESRGAFWNPIDFMLDVEVYDGEMDEEESMMKEIMDSIKSMAKTQTKMVNGVKVMSEVIQALTHSMTKDEENEQK